jgi:hypothetical protein
MDARKKQSVRRSTGIQQPGQHKSYIYLTNGARGLGVHLCLESNNLAALARHPSSGVHSQDHAKVSNAVAG